jgi:hypothetical protein
VDLLVYKTSLLQCKATVVFLEVLFHLIRDDSKLTTHADDNTMLGEMQEDAIEVIYDM